MRVFSEIQRFDQWWLYLLKILLWGFLGYACYNWFMLKESVGNVDSDNIIAQLLVVTSIVLTTVLFFLLKLETSIDERGIAYRFYPFQFGMKLIQWDAITTCITRRYKPMLEYGGWGYRMGTRGKALNVKGNIDIQIELKSGKRILIGTQKREHPDRVISKYFNS
ncbi:MAG: hypothetical protein AAF634_17640 [Bacteroidota bacterium]